jgi:uncharacterized lipoprotein YbaY
VNEALFSAMNILYAANFSFVPVYELEARIELQGRLLWINDRVHYVQLTDADQTGLKIQVVQVNG